MFTVIVERKAGKTYRKMPEFYRRRVRELGKILELNPVPAEQYDTTKLGGYDDSYRVRIGGIRISYEVLWDAKEVHIFEIEWRGGAYK